MVLLNTSLKYFLTISASIPKFQLNQCHPSPNKNSGQGLHEDIKSSWKDREQKLNKGLELRKFEQGIKNLYLWISDEGESFIRSHNLFSTSSASLTATFAEFNSFQRQMGGFLFVCFMCKLCYPSSQRVKSLKFRQLKK